MEMEEDGLQKYQFGKEDENMEGEGMSLMVRYSGDGVPKTVMGDQNEPGSSYNLRSGWYLSELGDEKTWREKKYDEIKKKISRRISYDKCYPAEDPESSQSTKLDINNRVPCVR